MVVHTFGDLLEAKEDIIIHGCNCFCTMNSGVARQIRQKWPGAYEADLETERGSKDKLGTWSSYVTPSGKLIINLYTQYRYGTDKQHFDPEAFREGMEAISSSFTAVTDIAMPRIGAGLGGAKWLDVENILNDIHRNLDVSHKKNYIIYNV